MKKYIALFTATAVIIFGAVLIPKCQNIPAVNVIVAEKKQINEWIVCSGQIEIDGQEKVNISIPIVVKSVKVSVGQKVKKGDILLYVDEKQTKQLISKSISESFLEAFSSMSSDSIPKAVIAPVGGTIKEINVSNGNTADPSKPMMIINKNNASSIVTAKISKDHISDVKIGQSAKITGTAFNKEYTGKVREISDTAKQNADGTSSKTADVKIAIDNPDDNLMSDIDSAKAQILKSSDAKGIVVPYEAVMQDDNNIEYVYIYSAQSVSKRDIKTGRELENGFEVLSGIKKGEMIVSDPQLVKKDDAKAVLAKVGGSN